MSAVNGDLRPLSTVELLDAAWSSVRANWQAIYVSSGLGTAPIALLVIGYFLWLGRLVEGTAEEAFYTGTLVWGGLMALGWTVNSIARSAVAALVIGEARGERIGLGGAWRSAFRHAPGSAFVGLCSFSAAWLAASCLVYPGLLLAAGWWVARPAMLVEDRAFGAALRRSWALTSGYRGRAFGLWSLLLALWGVGLMNLHLLAGFLLGTVADLLGVDTSGVRAQLNWGNQAYLTFLVSVLFVLLDPLKTAAEAHLYLDLRVRREGADLSERLRRVRAAANGAALLLLLTALFAGPASAVSTDEYRARVQDLRRRLEGARSPAEVEGQVRGLRELIVDAGGRKLTVRNRWLGEGADWKSPAEKARLLRRIEALERAMGAPTGTSPGPGPAAPPETVGDPKATLEQILAEPEFQRLAERPELGDLAKRLDLSQTRNWWDSFWKWVQRAFFRPARPDIPNPNLPPVRMDWMNWVMWVVLGALVVALVVLLIRWFMERPSARETEVVEGGAAPPLEASKTENALDHTVDEWELFARKWLERGEIREAVRALYLATLVHLHRERHIEYNRAFTNWIYVRQFRGEPEKREVLSQLTRVFDEVWYGNRACGREAYRRFETGARALGTPAPAVGGPDG